MTMQSVIEPYQICPNCRRELKVGQRVIRTAVLKEPIEGEGYDAICDDLVYQHANCAEADGPRYNSDGLEEFIPSPEYIAEQRLLGESS